MDGIKTRCKKSVKNKRASKFEEMIREKRKKTCNKNEIDERKIDKNWYSKRQKRIMVEFPF